MSTKKKKEEGVISVGEWLAVIMGYPLILSGSVIQDKGKRAKRESGFCCVRSSRG